MKKRWRNARISDASLCLLVRYGGKKSAETLYEAYANFLFLSIIRIVHDRKLAEQLLEDTFKKVWSSMSEYDIDIEPIYSWMNTIARGLAKKALLTVNK
ncbi:RNA polymerase sigma factor [Mucilaginibacter kameinonensis]|uniref:RNA polymerase sigma factor n=1 Tax=Mucilaginibacter kameinonensis TaxID=452286 RepID=UPI000EF80D7A|nr:sigma factor [Mucilaginibacter kameinonensis]